MKIQKEKETPQTGKEFTMLNLINSIPEQIGWTLVGFAACLCLVMAVKLGETFVQMWRDRHEDKTETCEA